MSVVPRPYLCPDPSLSPAVLRERADVDVEDFEPVVHRRHEQTPGLGRMPFESPDPASDVDLADRDRSLRMASVEQSDAGVVAASDMSG